jgi:hypothetical protein
MPPRARKGADPAGKAEPAAKRPKAEKAAATAAARPPHVEADEPDLSDPSAADATDAEAVLDSPTGQEAEPTAVVASTVLSRDTSEESSSNRHVEPDGTLIESRTVRTTRTLRGYEPGHTVEETVTVTTERTERVPVPYAGPASEHPAPVG